MVLEDATPSRVVGRMSAGAVMMLRVTCDGVAQWQSSGGVLGARPASSRVLSGLVGSVDLALERPYGTWRDSCDSLVMKGSPVRVRASALAR
jgi:hypothetical protein